MLEISLECFDVPYFRRGTCKSCGLQVFWSNLHLASHKRNKCNIPVEEMPEWDPKFSGDPQKPRTKRSPIDIGSYLENKNALTRCN